MNRDASRVAIVGAGPGDPGLLTVRARDLLERAQVVLHDALVSTEVLSLAPASAERIDIGRRAGGPAIPQRERNEILLRHARTARRVVRLKGGDPFVFGRGGEEALVLAEAGIPFEVVPGVTSGVAAAAYAGIPVTHRGLSGSVLFVTASGGTEGTESTPPPDWARVAGAGTIVCFMMGSDVRGVARDLLRNGRPAEEPAAVISHGTRAGQRTVVLPLSRLAEEGAPDLPAPRILVVGPTVALRERLAWFESRPLAGRTILVTRDEERASGLAGPLRDLGALAIPCPCIRIEPAPDLAALETALRAGGEWLAVTSASGASALAATLARMGADVRLLAGWRVASVGPATSEALRSMGIRPDLEPPEATSARLGEEMAAHLNLRGRRVLLWQAEGATDDLASRLEVAGARIARATAYRTVREAALPPAATAALRDGPVAGITFTSSSCVEAFATLCPPDLRAKTLSVPAFCIGPVTKGTAREAGFRKIHVASPHTVPGLAACVSTILVRERPNDEST